MKQGNSKLFDMRNILKLFIPSGDQKEVKELESWTVSWRVSGAIRWGDPKEFNKCFVDENEAKEFRRQLVKSAEFIKTPIVTEIVRN